MLQPPDMGLWRGRVDSGEGELGRRWHQLARPVAQATETGAVIVGFACDVGVSRNQGRPGAKRAPEFIRRMLANLPVRGCTDIFDAGDVICAAEALEEAQDELAGLVARQLDAGLFPLVLGGGHEVAYGSFAGLGRHLHGQAQPASIGIINLDAHFDLRLETFASSGTPFLQIADHCAAADWPFHYCCLGISDFSNSAALFARAKALGVLWRRDEDMTLNKLDQLLVTVTAFMARVDHLYLTICLDVLPAAVAPGVSAPAARGVSLEVIEPLIDRICASGKLRLADIAELNPDKDIDQRTARVAARLAGRIIEGRTLGQGRGAQTAQQDHLREV